MLALKIAGLCAMWFGIGLIVGAQMMRAEFLTNLIRKHEQNG